MANLNDNLELIKSQLQLIAPSRTVTRTFKEWSLYNQEQRLAGVLTIISNGLQIQTNQKLHNIIITGQIDVLENDSGEILEQKEFELFNNIETLVSQRNIPLNFGNTPLQQSQQLEHPYGWIVSELQIKYLNKINLGGC